jgi:hypothetical protein
MAWLEQGLKELLMQSGGKKTRLQWCLDVDLCRRHPCLHGKEISMKKINPSSGALSLPRNYFCRFLAALTMGMGVCEGAPPQTSTGKDHDNKTAYEVRPIGRVHNKKGQAVRLEIFKEFLPGLHRIDLCSHVTVIWWFHQNDTPAKRSILSVHPLGPSARQQGKPAHRGLRHPFTGPPEPPRHQHLQDPLG